MRDSDQTPEHPERPGDRPHAVHPAAPAAAPDTGSAEHPTPVARTAPEEAGGTAADSSHETAEDGNGPQRTPGYTADDGKLEMFPHGAGPSVNPAGSHHERRIRTFEPRRGRVTSGQRAALLRLWPKWGFDIDGQHRIDLGDLFAEAALDPQLDPNRDPALGPALPVVLEIGFGMGEATAVMAEQQPELGVLAVDVHTPGQGNLLRLADEKQLTNVRVGNGDAIILLRDMLPPESLSGLRIYFPDPWPKKRHHKRRLIQPEFLDLAAGTLRSGALVHCATDWEEYAEQMLEVLTAHPAYENTAADGGFAPRPTFRPRTRFEGRGLDQGHQVHDLLFRRR